MIDAAWQRLGRPARAEWTVGIVVAMTATAWVCSPLLQKVAPGISDPGIAMTGALLLFLLPAGSKRAPVLNWQAAERLPWGVLVLFGGGLSLARAVEQTGLTLWIGEAMRPLGAMPLVVVVMGVTTVIVFLTELTSNTATAAAFLPVVASLAVAAAICVATGEALSFLL